MAARFREPIVVQGVFQGKNNKTIPMKTAYKLTIVSSLFLAAGCSAWHERHAKNEQRNEQNTSYSDSGASTTSDTNVSSNFQPSTSQSTTSGRITGITPQTQTFGQTGADNGVVQQVQQQLTQDPSLAALVPNLQISFQNGTMILAGNVPSEQEKTKIETIVKSTTGVINVNNQLQVSSQSQLNLPGASENKQAIGGTSDQSTTTQSAGNQLSQPETTESANPAVPPSPSRTGQQSLLGQYGTNQFGQSSQNGLSPNQNRPDQYAQDQNLSPTADQQNTSRIYSTNQSTFHTSDPSTEKGTGQDLNVKIQAATEADRTLGQQVVQELRTDTTLTTLLPKIRINVESGKITLSGTVKSEDQKKKIESAVQRVTGVSSVEDHLRVGASGSEDATTQDNQQENK